MAPTRSSYSISISSTTGSTCVRNIRMTRRRTISTISTRSVTSTTLNQGNSSSSGPSAGRIEVAFGNIENNGMRQP